MVAMVTKIIFVNIFLGVLIGLHPTVVLVYYLTHVGDPAPKTLVWKPENTQK